MTALRRKLPEDSPAGEARDPARQWRSPWSLDDEWEEQEVAAPPAPKKVAVAPDPIEPPRGRPHVLVVPAVSSQLEAPRPKPSVAASEAAIRLANATRSSAQALTAAAPPPAQEASPWQAPITLATPVAEPAPAPVQAPEPAPAAKEPPPAEPKVAKTVAAPKPPTEPLPHLVYRQPTFSWWSPLLITLGLVGMSFLLWIYWQDEPAKSDADLRLSLPVDQATQTSAPRRLRSFLDSIVALEDHSLVSQPPWQWNTPALAHFVSGNGAAFDNLRDLLEDYDWHPRHAAWYVTDLGEHHAWPQVTMLLQAQAAYLVRRGDEENAFTTAVDLAEFSRRLQELWSWPSFAARSGESHAACVQALAELLKRTRLDSERLGLFQKEFADCQPSRQMLSDALTAYYIHEKKLLLGAESGELLDTMPRGVRQRRAGRLFFKMNQTLDRFAGAFRELKAEVASPPSTAFDLTGDKVRNTRQTAPQFYQPNATGERYFADRIDLYLDLPEQHNLAVTHHQLVLGLFALRRHVADHQRLPAGLAELRPAYLAEIPIDPFSGKSPHYDAVKGLLYSVGINYVAEGGAPTQPPLSDPREPTVELGIAAARVVR